MFSLIQLPYSVDALEPVISARTLEFHHGKHLKGYVDNLNKLIVGSKWESLCHSDACPEPVEGRSEESILAEIVAGSDGAIFNNAGQILNHNMYFAQFAPAGVVRQAHQPVPEHSVAVPEHSVAVPEHSVAVPEPVEGRRACHSERSEESSRSEESHGPLMAQIIKQWGTLEAFQAEFVAKGVSLFGSGWVWLSAAEDGTLVITQEPGASNPVVRGLKPILTFDVWEHAYYLDYQNRRADQLAALWQILDWNVVESRY